MYWLWLLVVLLVVLGSVLAMAEASVSRMTRIQALALRDAGRRNAEILTRIEDDPAPYLNAIYLCVMFVQNGSAIFVAVLAEQAFGELWVTVLSIGGPTSSGRVSGARTSSLTQRGFGRSRRSTNAGTGSKPIPSTFRQGPLHSEPA
jgi:CBS domain containing-hemolysin-like protein